MEDILSKVWVACSIATWPPAQRLQDDLVAAPYGAEKTLPLLTMTLPLVNIYRVLADGYRSV